MMREEEKREEGVEVLVGAVEEEREVVHNEGLGNVSRVLGEGRMRNQRV
jgi:hypothetical protein